MSYREIKNRANLLRKAKEYQEATDVYEKLVTEYVPECDKWDYWGYAFCLKQIKDYDKAIAICRNVLLKEKDFQNLRNLLAWCLYLSLPASFNELECDSVTETINEITEICGNDQDYSPLSKVVFKAVKYYKEKNRYDLMLEYLELLDETKLDDGQLEFNTNNRKVALASEKEHYYNQYSEALMKTGLYERCLEVCRKGLGNVKSFSNSNGLWLKRREALCLMETGELSQAISILKMIGTQKKEWFIFKEIADALHKQGDNKSAMSYYLQAITSHGDISMKVKLFECMGDLLSAENLQEEARKHYLMTFYIRNKNGWGIDPELMKKIGSLPDKVEYHRLLQELETIWKKVRESTSVCYKGVISGILPTNKAGFIKAEDGKSYYFSLIRNRLEKKMPAAGTRVTFSLEDSFDRKKNRPTKEAVGVVIVG